MHALDTIAHAGRWRLRHPAEKAVLAFGLLGCAVALPPWPGALLAGGAALAALLGPAGVTPAQLWRVARYPMVFVLVGSVPLLVAVGGDPFLRFAPDGLAQAAGLAGRATAALLCVLLFAATTPLADTIARLERLGVPPAVGEVAVLVHRMLHLLVATIGTVREAQAGRLGYHSWGATVRSVAGQAGAVFVGAFDRARRMEEGLALRGYTGSLRVQVQTRPISRPFVAVSLLVVVAVLAGSLAIMGSTP